MAEQAKVFFNSKIFVVMKVNDGEACRTFLFYMSATGKVTNC